MAFEILYDNIESTKKFVDQIEDFLSDKKLLKKSVHQGEENEDIDISKFHYLFELEEKLEQYFRDFKKITKMADLLIKKPSEIPINEISCQRSERILKKTKLFLDIVT